MHETKFRIPIPKHQMVRLKRLRLRSGLSLRDTAKRLGITAPTLIRYEKKIALTIDRRLLAKWVKMFGIQHG